MQICKGLRLHLQHDYCALCFRVRAGRFTKVNRNDARIDAVQAAHALKGRNGLRLLDLSRPGDPCPIDSGCRMICLVCGGAVMNEDSRDWARIVCFAKPAEDTADERKRASVLRQAALRNRCRMTSRWSTFVHERFGSFFGQLENGRSGLTRRQLRGALAELRVLDPKGRGRLLDSSPCSEIS